MKLRVAHAAALMMLAATACYGPNREPGDDPNRSDEGPTAGKPATDPYQTVEPKDASAGGDDDLVASPDEGRGTLDGSSDELAAPERPRQ